MELLGTRGTFVVVPASNQTHQDTVLLLGFAWAAGIFLFAPAKILTLIYGEMPILPI